MTNSRLLSDCTRLVTAASLFVALTYILLHPSVPPQSLPAGFPYVGVFSSVPGSTPTRPKFQRLWTQEGACGREELLSRLQAALATASATLDGISAERVARDSDRQLREEQDRSYREAEAEDRRRTAARNAARAAEELRRKEAEEASSKAEGERGAAVAMRWRASRGTWDHRPSTAHSHLTQLYLRTTGTLCQPNSMLLVDCRGCGASGRDRSLTGVGRAVGSGPRARAARSAPGASGAAGGHHKPPSHAADGCEAAAALPRH